MVPRNVQYSVTEMSLGRRRDNAVRRREDVFSLSRDEPVFVPCRGEGGMGMRVRKMVRS